MCDGRAIKVTSERDLRFRHYSRITPYRRDSSMISMMTTYLPQPLEPQMTVKGKRNSTHCSSSLGLKERTPRIARRLMLAMVLHYGTVGMVLVLSMDGDRLGTCREEYAMLCYGRTVCWQRGVSFGRGRRENHKGAGYPRSRSRHEKKNDIIIYSVWLCP